MLERANLRNYWFEFIYFFVLDIAFIEEGFRLYNVALQLIGAKHHWKLLRKWGHPLRALAKSGETASM